MTSKAFSEHMKKFSAMSPDGPMPMMDRSGIPPEYTHLQVPMFPPDRTLPTPVIPDGFEGGVVTMGGVTGLHITCSGLRPGAAMLHLHGGGWTIGSAMNAGPLLARFAEEAGLEGYSAEYRLAPYHPFPAAIDDCLCFYRGLLDAGYQTIVVGGESAGAALTISLVHALKAEGLPLPAALWCSSPLDGLDADEREVYKEDNLIGSFGDIRLAYAPGADLRDPRLSPIHGNFENFPPMFIQVGGGESLAAGGVRLAVAAMRENNEVVLHFGKDMPHTFAMDYSIYPEAEFAMHEFTAFIRHILDLK